MVRDYLIYLNTVQSRQISIIFLHVGFYQSVKTDSNLPWTIKIAEIPIEADTGPCLPSVYPIKEAEETC